jgi:hypothetical protein
MTWVDVIRSADANRERPLVTFRQGGRGEIGLNASFVKKANAEDVEYLTFQLAKDDSKIAISFIQKGEKVPRNAFRLGLDSRNKVTNGRVVTAPSLKSQSLRIKKVCSMKEAELCRFEPVFDKFERKWIINLRPNFEIKVSGRLDIPKNTCGIYRYLKEEEVVYVGRGNVRSRADDSVRENWIYDSIEYSIVPNEQQRIELESFYIEYFSKKLGRLPMYNRVSGTSTSAQ